MNSNNKNPLQQAAPRSNAKWLPSHNEAVILPEVAITAKRTLAEQGRRDQFLAAVEQTRNWVTMLTYCAQRDNWSEVEFMLQMSDRICETMQDAFARPNNKDGN